MAQSQPMTGGRLGAVPLWLWVALFGLADLSMAWPGLDLAVAGWFHDPVAGFAARGLWWEQFAFHSIRWLLGLVVLVLIGHWLWLRWQGDPRARATGRRLTWLLALLVLVPGLLVNGLLKNHWHRPRPVQVQGLGGDRPMAPAFVPVGQGGGAFSSGHAAAAAWLVAVAVTLTGGRSAWVALAVGYALLVGLARMAAGGHFLSDVLTSYLLVWIGWYLLRPWRVGAGDPLATPTVNPGALPDRAQGACRCVAPWWPR